MSSGFRNGDNNNQSPISSLLSRLPFKRNTNGWSGNNHVYEEDAYHHQISRRPIRFNSNRRSSSHSPTRHLHCDVESSSSAAAATRKRRVRSNSPSSPQNKKVDDDPSSWSSLHMAEIAAAEAAARAVISGISASSPLRRMPHRNLCSTTQQRGGCRSNNGLLTTRPNKLLLPLIGLSCIMIFGAITVGVHERIDSMPETAKLSPIAMRQQHREEIMLRQGKNDQNFGVVKNDEFLEKTDENSGSIVKAPIQSKNENDSTQEKISAAGKNSNNAVIAYNSSVPLTKVDPPPCNHKHAIPPILIFTHHTNLLTTPKSSLPDQEDSALAANVQHTISQHPNTTIRFLTDSQCLTSIQNALNDVNTPLTTYFTNETHGMYKADICRGAALYETGGLYFDIDIETRMNVWDAIDTHTEFVVPLVHMQHKYPGTFFQAFIGVTKGHPIMKRYLELFIEYYEGRIQIKGEAPLGVLFLRKAFDQIYGRIGNGELKKNKVQFWQEVLHDKKLFPNVKAPNRGKRRACKFVVVVPSKEKPYKVPFYSRVKGSRMCGGRDTEKQK